MKKYCLFICITTISALHVSSATAITAASCSPTTTPLPEYVNDYTSCNPGFYMTEVAWTGSDPLSDDDCTTQWNGEVCTTSVYHTCTKCPSGTYKTTSGTGGIDECKSCPTFTTPVGNTVQGSTRLIAFGDSVPDSPSDCYIPALTSWNGSDTTGQYTEQISQDCYAQ